MRVVFMGTPEFAVPTLRALRASAHEVVGVVTKPPRPAHRGHHPEPTPVERAADGLPILHALALDDAATQAAILAWRPEVLIVVAFVYLPDALYRAVPHGALNVHASLLPAYRGANPIQRAVLDGARESGVTIMRIAEGYDTGAILRQVATPLDPRETFGTLYARLSVVGAEALVSVLDAIARGESLPIVEQDASRVTRAPKLREGEERIDVGATVARADALVRACDPTPGAIADVLGQRVKVWRAHPSSAVDASNAVRIACADGDLILDEVQPLGRKRMDARAWRNGLRA